MRQGYTHISMLIDRSGSMESVRADTVGGVNSFVETQKKVTGEATLSLSVFDHEYSRIFQFRNVKDVDTFTDQDFRPRGNTALIDAFARFIAETGEEIRRMPEERRPEKVIFVVVTDGQENASRETGIETLRESVSHQKNKYGWDFIFLGANIDAFATGSRYGVAGLQMAAGSAGIAQGFRAAGTYVGLDRYASLGSVVARGAASRVVSSTDASSNAAIEGAAALDALIAEDEKGSAVP